MTLFSMGAFYRDLCPSGGIKHLEMKFEIPISSEDQTVELGEQLAGLLKVGDVIGMRGDLGAGKTFLSCAVARALGVPEGVAVNSPTFTLINEYHGGRLPVYHMDLYRLSEAAELYELGLWEYYDGDGVCLVEWCDRFEDLWPEGALVLTIQLLEGEARNLVVEGEGRAAELVKALTHRPGAE